MSKNVPVVCPFSGTEIQKEAGDWVAQVPGTIDVWYFPDDGDEDVLAECVARAMGMTEVVDCVRKAIPIIREQGNLVVNQGWCFVRLPVVPTFRLVNPAEMIIAKSLGLHGQVELFEEVSRRVGDYKHEIACAWAAN